MACALWLPTPRCVCAVGSGTVVRAAPLEYLIVAVSVDMLCTNKFKTDRVLDDSSSGMAEIWSKMTKEN